MEKKSASKFCAVIAAAALGGGLAASASPALAEGLAGLENKADKVSFSSGVVEFQEIKPDGLLNINLNFNKDKDHERRRLERERREREAERLRMERERREREERRRRIENEKRRHDGPRRPGKPGPRPDWDHGRGPGRNSVSAMTVSDGFESQAAGLTEQVSSAAEASPLAVIRRDNPERRAWMQRRARWERDRKEWRGRYDRWQRDGRRKMSPAEKRRRVQEEKRWKQEERRWQQEERRWRDEERRWK